MEKITGNENAFAIAAPEGSYVYPGLTIRQYFAAMAMQGLLAMIEKVPKDWQIKMAKNSVAMADALITELNRQP